MNDIMKQIRELKDEIAYLEADKKQLIQMVKDLENIYGVRTSGLEILMRVTMMQLRIDGKKERLKELRRATYHIEGECQYYLLDLNDIAGVIDKDGFIRGIKF